MTKRIRGTKLYNTIPGNLTFALTLFSTAIACFVAQGAISYLVSGDSFLSGIPPQVLLVLSAFILLIFTYPRYFEVTVFKRSIAIVAIIFCIAILSCLKLYSAYASTEEKRYFFQLCIGIVIFILAEGLVFYEKPTKRLLTLLFLSCGFSGLCAVYEAITGEAMPWARSGYIAPLSGHGAQGLEWFPVAFAYSCVPAAIMASLMCIFKSKSYAAPHRIICYFCSISVASGLFAAASRSGMFGIVFGVLLGLHLRNRGSIGNLLKILSIGSVIIFIACKVLFTFLDKPNPLEDARLYATVVFYLPVIITNPLGVIDWQIQDLGSIIDFHRQIGWAISDDAFDAASLIAPHNGFLTAGVKYGVIGLFGLIWLFVMPMRNGLRLNRMLMRTNSFLEHRLFLISLMSATVGYIVHLSFHNMSLFTGDMRNWLPLGLLFGTITLLKKLILRTTQP